MIRNQDDHSSYPVSSLSLLRALERIGVDPDSSYSEIATGMFAPFSALWYLSESLMHALALSHSASSTELNGRQHPPPSYYTIPVLDALFDVDSDSLPSALTVPLGG